MVRGQFWIQIQLQILFYLNLGSTPALAQLSSLWWWGQLQIWIQLQLHVWVVLFNLNLESALALALALVASLPHLSSLWWWGQLQTQVQLQINIWVYFLPEFRVHSSSSSPPIYVSIDLLVVGGQLQILVWLQILVQLQIYVWVVLFYLNLGFHSGSSPIYVSPELIVVGGLTLHPDQAPDPYLGCTFWTKF